MQRVSLISKSEEIGRKHGRLVSDLIRKRLSVIYEQAEKKKVSKNELLERANQFGDILKIVSPRWLEEAEGIAQEAGVRGEDFLVLNSLPDGFWSDGEQNCTSFMAG
jgi:hypothetical protein